MLNIDFGSNLNLPLAKRPGTELSCTSSTEK